MNALELDDVTKEHPGSPVVVALRSVSIVIAEGEFVAVVGPSGSGHPELFRLIGYYLSEGSCDGGRRVDFDFQERDERLAKDAVNLITKFFDKSPKIKKNGENGIRLVLDSAMAEDFFSQFGKGAENKKMPDWVFFAEPAKQLELLKRRVAGDRCRIKQTRRST